MHYLAGPATLIPVSHSYHLTYLNVHDPKLATSNFRKDSDPAVRHPEGEWTGNDHVPEAGTSAGDPDGPRAEEQAGRLDHRTDAGHPVQKHRTVRLHGTVSG